MSHTIYHFEWDAAKARGNVAKHGITFKLAMSVLHDLLALTIFRIILARKAERDEISDYLTAPR